ncbi:hypothetical protein N3K66_000217 [Trichothecium roseum]|uniref:Uncharacterized protein n=1 Tax=Trichothecium roseum TaxID=47278 RepID=A0ACC0VC31_9HYPO|nr:hypothetical protein N3K66_000217 [Trichothecium roseum]
MSANTDHSEERIEEKEHTDRDQQRRAEAHQSPSPQNTEPENGHISVAERVSEYPGNVAAGPAASAPPSPSLHAATDTQVSLASAAQPTTAGAEVQLDALPADAGSILDAHDDAAVDAFLSGYSELENLAAYQGDEVPAPDFSSGWFEETGGGGVDTGAGADDDDDEVLIVGVQPKPAEVICISSDAEESDDDDFTSNSDIDVRKSGDGDGEVDAGDDGFLDFLNHQDPDPELEGGDILGPGSDDELESDEQGSPVAPAPAPDPAPAPTDTPAATPTASEQEAVDIPDIDHPSPSLSPSSSLPSPPLPTTHAEQGQAALAEDWYAQFPDGSRGRELSPISQLLAPFLPGPPSTGAAEGEPKEQSPSPLLAPAPATAPAATPGRGERAAQQHHQQGGVRGRRPPPNRPLPWGSVAGLVGVAEIQSRRPGWRPINYRRGAAGGAMGREDNAVSQERPGSAEAGDKRGSEEGEGDEERPAKRHSP